MEGTQTQSLEKTTLLADCPRCRRVMWAGSPACQPCRTADAFAPATGEQVGHLMTCDRCGSRVRQVSPALGCRLCLRCMRRAGRG